MDRLPQAMAERFSEGGGNVLLGHELVGFDASPQGLELVFAGGQRARASRLVLALPRPAVDAFADGAPLLRRPDVRRLVESTTAYPALKLYLWYDRPWWRDDGFAGHRMTTDLPLRKTFYLDSIEATDAPGPSLLLAAYMRSSGSSGRRPSSTGWSCVSTRANKYSCLSGTASLTRRSSGTARRLPPESLPGRPRPAFARLRKKSRRGFRRSGLRSTPPATAGAVMIAPEGRIRRTV